MQLNKIYILIILLNFSLNLSAESILNDIYIEIENLDNTSLVVTGNFRNVLLGDHNLIPEYFIERNTIEPKEKKTYKVKTTDYFIGDLFVNDEPNSLKIIARPNDTVKIKIFEWSQQEKLFMANSDYDNILKYLVISKYLMLPEISVDATTYFNAIDVCMKNELSEIKNLPGWFYEIQRSRISWFYESLTLDYKRRKYQSNKNSSTLWNTNSDEIHETLNGEIKFDKYYYKFISSLINFKHELLKNNDLANSLYDEEVVKMNLASDMLSGLNLDCYFLVRAIAFDDHSKLFATSLKEIASSRIVDNSIRNYFESIELRKRLKEGILAYDFDLIDKNEVHFKLNQFQGRTVLLAFWFTACPSCHAEFEFENELKEEYSSDRFIVINICVKSSKENWLNTTNNGTMKVLSLYASEDQSIKLEEYYKIKTYPSYTLLDSDGKIVLDKCFRPSDKRLKVLIEETLE